MSDKSKEQAASIGCIVLFYFALQMFFIVTDFLWWAYELASDVFNWISVHFWYIISGFILLLVIPIVARWLLMLLNEATAFRGAARDGEVYGEPFVSEGEVLRVGDHWLDQERPEYIQAVTEDPEDDAADFRDMDGHAHEEDPQYRKACQIVFESQRASASWLQRQLRIGYNSAAELIDRMEEDGFIGARDHIGRREVLRDRNGDPV